MRGVDKVGARADWRWSELGGRIIKKRERLRRNRCSRWWSVRFLGTSGPNLRAGQSKNNEQLEP